MGLVISTVSSSSMLVAAAATAPSVIAVVVPMAVFSAGLGIVLPSAMAAAMAPFPSIAGYCFGLLGFFQMLVACRRQRHQECIAAQLTLPMAMVIAAGTALALLGFILLVRPHQFSHHSSG